MEVKTITYKRIHNLSNYNSEHLEMTVELDKNEDEDQATAILKQTVCDALNIVDPESEPAF